MSKTRAAYYLLLIALLMPALPDGKSAGQKALHVKTAAVAQTGGMFCASSQGLCGATSYLLRKFEAKAKYPIYVLNSWSNQRSTQIVDHKA